MDIDESLAQLDNYWDAVQMSEFESYGISIDDIKTAYEELKTKKVIMYSPLVAQEAMDMSVSLIINDCIGCRKKTTGTKHLTDSATAAKKDLKHGISDCHVIYDNGEWEGSIAFLFLEKMLLATYNFPLHPMPEEIHEVASEMRTHGLPTHALIILSPGCLDMIKFATKMVISFKVGASLVGITASSSFVFPMASWWTDMVDQKGAFTSTDMDEVLKDAKMEEEFAKPATIESVFTKQLFADVTTVNFCQSVKTMTNAFVPSIQLENASIKIINEQTRAIYSRFVGGMTQTQSKANSTGGDSNNNVDVFAKTPSPSDSVNTEDEARETEL
jgi:hypothetical protein